ncbi:MAG: CDP-diacylglycerol--glycerol-3-phosphate 3-phosphatidyltransferase [Candidatus Marinimicrobia bacterium]|nr:CDP-diacylglycerol--glycerol-3-phosphate 3-phosphatidyltransferase [Candidatus Neomarinimicrobiota bacterium]
MNAGYRRKNHNLRNLPNILTIFRILITPIFLFCLFNDFYGSKFYSLFLFILASVTDAFDGYYARKNNLVSKLGIFLDPLADKILVSSAFISFAILGYIDYWMFAIIFFRDIFVTLLRMVMIKNGYSMTTSKIAKSKTFIQVSVIIFTLSAISISGFNWFSLHPLFSSINIFELIYYLTFLVTIFTAFTGFTYLFDNKSQLREILSS